MNKRLPKLALPYIALAFAAAAPLGAQGTHDVSKQWAWCQEQPSIVARQGLQNGPDLEPLHAAVLAACADIETGALRVLGTFGSSAPVASRGDESWRRWPSVTDF